MEWFRRMFGYPDSGSSHNCGPFRNPTWDEIFDSRNFNDRPQPPNDHYKDFHRGGSFSYSTGESEDSFSSVFGQMDDMFRQLDSIMQGFHGFHDHPGHVFITELPESEDSSSAQSPRDSLLKKPDSEVPEGSSPQHTVPRSQSPFHGPHISDPEDRDNFSGSGGFGRGPRGDFGGFQEFGMVDPFQMMEDIFRSFGGGGFGVDPFGGGGFGMGPFGGNPGAPMLPKPETDSRESSRDAIVKKDSDLDDRITGGFSDLLKDMPGYNPPVIPGQRNVTPHSETHPQPQVQQRFHSTSVVRIRRPDGSVEETRKYTDSTGHEEVTVTRTEPERNRMPGSLLKPGDQGLYDGQSSPDHVLPSIFSWFFTR